MIGTLGIVLPYRQRIEDLDHELIGWYVTPARPAPGCMCELCVAGHESHDVHLGSVSRTALYRAGVIVTDHLHAQRASA
jgi:hypothetical protein